MVLLLYLFVLITVCNNSRVEKPQQTRLGLAVFSDFLPDSVREYSLGFDLCFKAYGLHSAEQSKSSLFSPLGISESENNRYNMKWYCCVFPVRLLQYSHVCDFGVVAGIELDNKNILFVFMKWCMSLFFPTTKMHSSATHILVVNLTVFIPKKHI